MVDNIVSLRCRSVVSGKGIVGLIHPVLLPPIDGQSRVYRTCLIRPLHTTPTMAPTPDRNPPPRMAPLSPSFCAVCYYYNSSGVARFSAGLIVGLIGWVAKAIRRSGTPQYVPLILPYHTIQYPTLPSHTILHYTIPYPSLPYHTTPHHTTPYHSISYHTTQYHTMSRSGHPWSGRPPHAVCQSLLVTLLCVFQPPRGKTTCNSRVWDTNRYT